MPNKKHKLAILKVYILQIRLVSYLFRLISGRHCFEVKPHFFSCSLVPIIIIIIIIIYYEIVHKVQLKTTKSKAVKNI